MSSVADSVIDRLSTDDPSLLRVRLPFTDIGDKEVERLAAALPHNSRIDTVDLSGNTVGDAGVVALAAALGAAPGTLTVLDLSRNRVGRDGAAALATALGPACRVERLSLAGNPLGDAGVVAISQGLAHNTSLVRLSLAYCGFGLAGAQALAGCLRTNTTLVSLDTTGNEVPTELAEELDELVAGRNAGLPVARIRSSEFQFVGASRPPPWRGIARVRPLRAPGVSADAHRWLSGLLTAAPENLAAVNAAVRDLKTRRDALVESLRRQQEEHKLLPPRANQDDESPDGDNRELQNLPDWENDYEEPQTGRSEADPSEPNELRTLRRSVRVHQLERLEFQEQLLIACSPESLSYYTVLACGLFDGLDALRRVADGLVDGPDRRPDYDARLDVMSGLEYVARRAESSVAVTVLGAPLNDAMEGRRHAEQLRVIHEAAAILESQADRETAAEQVSRQLTLAMRRTLLAVVAADPSARVTRDEVPLETRTASVAGGGVGVVGGSSSSSSIETTAVHPLLKQLAYRHCRQVLALLLKNGNKGAAASGDADAEPIPNDHVDWAPARLGGDHDALMNWKCQALCRAVMGSDWRYRSPLLDEAARQARRASVGGPNRPATRSGRNANARAQRRAGRPVSDGLAGNGVPQLQRSRSMTNVVDGRGVGAHDGVAGLSPTRLWEAPGPGGAPSPAPGSHVAAGSAARKDSRVASSSSSSRDAQETKSSGRGGGGRGSAGASQSSQGQGGGCCVLQ